MKQSSKNEAEMLGLMNKIQEQLVLIDKKVDTLINRSLSAAKPSPTPPVNKERVMYTVICADCKKECKIPFKPSGDRPVYCQDCFSRRKVINLSGITLPSTQTPPVETKKKAVTVKKSIAKKKLVPKKK